jgi:uncharacterized protein YkwD
MEEQEVFMAVNQYRAQHALRQLAADPVLTRAGDQDARFLAQRDRT